MRWVLRGRRKWLLWAVVIGLLWWLTPKIYRELLPVNSQFLMQEAYATADAIEPAGNRAIAMTHIARALVHAGDIEGARRFVQNGTIEVQMFAYPEIGHALIDKDGLDDALEIARFIYQQYGSYHGKYNFAGLQIPDDMLNTALLFQRLAHALMEANRLSEALEVAQMLQADAEAKDEATNLLCVIAHHAAETGQLVIAIRAIEALPKNAQTDLPWLRLARLAIEAGDLDGARHWLQRYKTQSICRPLNPYADALASLPPEWEARVKQVERLAQRNQITHALTLTEQTLRNYLKRHNQHTIDYDLLRRMAARLTALLPFDATRRTLERLSTQGFVCAETNLVKGFAYGLAISGREHELEQFLSALNDAETANDAREILLLRAAAEGRRFRVEQLLRQAGSPALKEYLALEAALLYASAGRLDEARQLLKTFPPRDKKQELLKVLESMKQPPLSLPDTLIPPIYAVVCHDETAFRWFATFWSPKPPSRVGTTQRQLMEGLESALSTASFHILKLRKNHYYPAVLRIVRHEQSINNDEAFGVLISYALQEMTKYALYQRFYDPLLGEAALAYREEEPRWSTDYARQKYLMYSAAAAAQVGQLQEAERLRREAGRVDGYLNAIYEAGYAIGLAKRGEFRAAARWARGVADPSWRVYALAEVAAEMKKHGL